MSHLVSAFAYYSRLRRSNCRMDGGRCSPTFLLVLSASPCENAACMHILFNAQVRGIDEQDNKKVFHVLMILVIGNTSPAQRLSIRRSLRNDVPAPGLQNRLRSPRHVPPPIPRKRCGDAGRHRYAMIYGIWS